MIDIFHQSVFDRWPLDDDSVQAIITSPPYWGLREYPIPDVIIGGARACKHKWSTGKLMKGNGNGAGPRRDKKAGIKRGSLGHAFCDKCEAFKGQYGLEPTPDLFIEHSRLWLSEAWRVLRPDGVIWVNIGDTYGGSWGRGNSDPTKWQNTLSGRDVIANQMPSQLPQQSFRKKSLLLIPERFNIAMFDMGFYVRDRIVWNKTNGIPESVKDRCTSRYEIVIMATKNPSYYFDLDSIRVPYKKDSLRRFKSGIPPQDISYPSAPGQRGVFERVQKKTYDCNPNGANPGNVWSIPSAKRPKGKHTATFPNELVRRCLMSSTRKGDLVVDPFCGVGTVIKVALENGRRSAGIDLGYEEDRDETLSNTQAGL